MAPSHPRLKPTPDVGSVSVDAIWLAIRKATGPAARRARFLLTPHCHALSPSTLLIEREDPLTRGTHLPGPGERLLFARRKPRQVLLNYVEFVHHLRVGFAQGIDRTKGEERLLMNTFSPPRMRTLPSFKRTSMVFGPMKQPAPISNFAPAA